MSEIWKDIDGFDGRYQISSYGRVRSFAHDKIKGRLLKLQPYSNGYLFAQLGRDGGSRLVHRLVAKAFIPGDHSLQVNHLNGVRRDNWVANLEWLSCSDNHRHSYRELDRKQHCKTMRVILVRRGEELEFPSMLAAAKHIGRAPGSVVSAANRGSLCANYEVHRAN